MSLLVLAALAGACAGTHGPSRGGGPLSDVATWAIQLQGYDEDGALDRLAYAPFDMVVLDPVQTQRGRETFPMGRWVARLRKSKLVLAYVNVGQAEDYRSYWRPHWRAPTKDQRGSPSYLLTVDPDGWPGNYPVAYWDPRWQAVLWGSDSAAVNQAIDAGFDGVYLDWVLGHEDPTVAQVAREAGVDPHLAMAEMIRDLRAYARSRNPDFLVIAQNAASLAEYVPEFVAWVDGVAQESISFGGESNVPWEDPRSGDVPTPRTGDWSTETLLRQLRPYVSAGKPVFTIDYCTDPDNAEVARTNSRSRGCIPFVTRTPLDRLP